MEFDSDNEKLQEFSVIIGDRIRSVGKKWWYALAFAILSCMPVYYMARAFFTNLAFNSHTFPAYIYEEQTKADLLVSDETIFKLGNNSYSAYFKIKNSTNHDWGAPQQSYTVSFATTAGTEVIAPITKTTFVLPSSEKIVVLPRFTSDKEPTVMKVVLAKTQFVFKPSRVDPNLTVEKVNLSRLAGPEFLVSAEVKNKTPFTIKEIGLPVLLYDAAGKVVGANYTSINNVLYTENRSFQYTWPGNPNAIRAEILPEANIYDGNIYQLPAGNSPFESSTQ